MKAFRRNPLLGSGYSSIDVGSDSSYFRALGETGLLGLLAFLGLFFALGLLAKQGLAKITDPFGRSVIIGMAAGVIGLLFNAILIDVFEASKVALVLWLLLGITAGMISYYLPKRRSLLKEAQEIAKWPIIPILLLGLIALLVFIPTHGNYFVADDFVWLKWAYRTSLKEIPQLFTEAQGFFYRPLTKTFFIITKPLFGLRPGGYHLVDYFLHFGCTFGAYFLVLRLTKKKLVALLAGLFFLIHPINAESVLWISSTSALFASFFYITGVLAYVYWRTIRASWRHFFYLATIIALILGLLSHERMITFPLVLLLYDFVFHHLKKKKEWASYLKIHLPFWFLTAVYLWLRNVVAQAHGLSGDYNYNFLYLPFNFTGNLIGYLGELTFSFHFLPFYDLARATLRTNKLIALGLLIIAALILIGLWFIKKRRYWKTSKVALFALGWLIIVLLPFLGLGNIAERHVYPAHLGFFILLALAIDWFYQKLKKRHLYLGISLALILVLAIFSFYLIEMEKAKSDWRQAGEVTNTILLALSSNFIEFRPGHSLHFVDLPIRQGRAWAFPVGLHEGIWFIYRDETLPIEITTDLEKTVAAWREDPFAHVFVFEEGELREIHK